ncbi:MAG: prephenate dehydratase, partial [Acidimicrobiales bacterium]|nr:prephenate dehydratase [Acidimicrobiales bacterium]
MAKDAPPSPSQLAYLGPAGTFTEQALLTQPDLAALDHVLASSISDVLRRVSTGEALLGFVAIENSIEGSVNITQDTLTFEADLLIQREVEIPVQLNLLVPSGTSLSDVQRVVSFPHAIAQCRGWLREHLPDADIDASNSTADAARRITDGDDAHVAAIAPGRAAEGYGLEGLAEDIEDHPENETRLVLVAADVIPAPTGHDKTSLVVFLRADRPG